MTDTQYIAEDVIRHLTAGHGQSALVAMTGARNLVALDNGLQFSFKGSRRANKCRVELKPDDTYTMTFYRLNRLHDCVSLSQFDLLSAGELAETFTRYTGLDTHL